MKDDIFNWTRKVSRAGYEIRTVTPVDTKKGSGKPGRYLCELPGAEREYRPLDDGSLFYTFAEAHPADEEGILRLANQYGWLFDHQFALAGEGPWAGEPVKSWNVEIEFLHSAVELWEAKHLRKWIKFKGAEAIYHGPLGFYRISAAETLTRAATHVLQRYVDEYLKRTCEVRFLWDLGHNSPAVHELPSSLLASLWLELAFAIQSKRPEDFRRCGDCRRRFDTAEEKRQDSKFCSNACRSRNYRKRLKEAQRLRDKGLSLREIARRLNSDTRTVKGWVIK